MLKDGGVLKERYRIIGYVGSGGQRRVYRAIDTKGGTGNRDVVIKEMFRGKSFKKDLVNAELTQQEVRILIDYPHPCIPRIFDLFMDHGTYYLVQEFIEGKTLKEMIQERKVLPEGEALGLILQIVEAVDYLHSQYPPIIIRDLKPSNVVVRHGRAFVVDLGGAQSDSAVGTDIENVSVSTRGYAPPEGVKARNAYTVDVFSAGVMLYQMITGYDPVANPGSLPGVRRLKPDIHPRLERIIQRAIHWDFRRRYPSMLQLKLDLEAYQRMRDRSGPHGPGAGQEAAAMLGGVVLPALMLLLVAADVALPLLGHAGLVPGLKAPPHGLEWAQLGFAGWAFFVHAIWRHWLAQLPALNQLARKLNRGKSPLVPIHLLVALNLVVLGVFIARDLMM